MDPYNFWSNAVPGLELAFDIRERSLDYPAMRRLIAQWRKLAPFYFGDYYPLTPYTNSASAWMAWQFHRPEADDGMIQAFRRPDCINHSATFPLHALDANAQYLVADLNAESPQTLTGQDLMQDGLRIDIPDKPGVAVIAYGKVD